MKAIGNLYVTPMVLLESTYLPDKLGWRDIYAEIREQLFPNFTVYHQHRRNAELLTYWLYFLKKHNEPRDALTLRKLEFLWGIAYIHKTKKEQKVTVGLLNRDRFTKVYDNEIISNGENISLVSIKNKYQQRLNYGVAPHYTRALKNWKLANTDENRHLTLSEQGEKLAEVLEKYWFAPEEKIKVYKLLQCWLDNQTINLDATDLLTKVFQPQDFANQKELVKFWITHLNNTEGICKQFIDCIGKELVEGKFISENSDGASVGPDERTDVALFRQVLEQKVLGRADELTKTVEKMKLFELVSGLTDITLNYLAQSVKNTKITVTTEGPGWNTGLREALQVLKDHDVDGLANEMLREFDLSSWPSFVKSLVQRHRRCKLEDAVITCDGITLTKTNRITNATKFPVPNAIRDWKEWDSRQFFLHIVECRKLTVNEATLTDEEKDVYAACQRTWHFARMLRWFDFSIDRSGIAMEDPNDKNE